MLSVAPWANDLPVVANDIIWVTTLEDTVGGTSKSLRDALAKAKTTSGADIIMFDESLYNEDGVTITLDSQLTINDTGAVYIVGWEDVKITFDGGNSFDTFFSITSTTVGFYGLDFVNATGSAIRATNSKTSIFDSSFENNSGGGALNISGGNLNVARTNFLGNSTTGLGGSITIGSRAEATISSCDFVYNNTVTNAATSGGAIYASGSGNLTIIDSSFTGFKATDGGAIYVASLISSAKLNISNSDFVKNTATSRGGAIYLYNVANANIDGDSLFQSNAATSYGGAICAVAGATGTVALTVSETDFISNRTTNNSTGVGGGIYIQGTASATSFATLSLSGTYFSGNTSKNGGAINATTLTNPLNQNINALTIEESLFEGNTATLNGGAVSLTNVSATFDKANFTGNSSESVGGAVAITGNSSSLTVIGSQFSDNVTSVRGGAIDAMNIFGSVSEAPALNVIGSSFVNNISSQVGGAISISRVTKEVVIGSETNFNSNRAINKGGAIFVNGIDATNEIYYVSTISIGVTTFIDNITRDSGGAIYIAADNSAFANVTIDGGNFTRNYASISGGAVYFLATQIEVSNSHFEANLAISQSGGAIYSLGSILTLDHVDLLSNTAQYSGGAIFSAQNVYNTEFQGEVSSLTATRSTIDGNYAKDGAGLWLSQTETEFWGVDIMHNNAAQKGGGVYMLNSNVNFNASVAGSDIWCCLVKSNSASHGGGLYIDNNPGLNLTSNVNMYAVGIMSNVATIDGGGAYVKYNSSLTLYADNSLSSNSLLCSNSALGDGGGIYLAGTRSYRPTLLIDNFRVNFYTVFDNVSLGKGGAICADFGVINLNNPAFDNNLGFGGYALDAIGSNLNIDGQPISPSGGLPGSQFHQLKDQHVH